ncbi:MAG: hypothetical protein PHY47_25280 [Lachnospiraceae bacterium]|nr:hypothetical protein [Lachnospiraceae bacterium]
MNRIEVLIKIQRIIEGLKKETVQVETRIKNILACIDNDDFISESNIQDAITHLKMINQMQKECKENYLGFMESKEFPDSVIKVITEVQDKAKTLFANQKYKSAIEVFFSLHSAQAVCESELKDLKHELSMDEIFKLSEKECKEKYNKYLDFVNAFKESDPEKLLDYIQKLKPHFDARLVVEVMQKSLFMEENSITCKEAHEQIIAEEELHISDYKKDNTAEEYTNEEQPAEKQENTGDETPEGNAYEHKIHRLIENEHFITESDSQKAYKTFGVKLFKSDINGSLNAIRVAILRCVFKFECVTCKILQLDIPYDKALIERESKYLINKGYLKEYIIDGTNALFCLTARGLKAFSTKDSASYLQLSSPKTKKEILFDGIDSAILYLVRAKALVHAVESLDTIKFSCKEIIFDKTMILCVCDKDASEYVYTTILNHDIMACEKFLEEIGAFIEGMEDVESSRRYVLGYNSEHSQNLKAILAKKLRCENLGCYVLNEDIWYEMDDHTQEVISDKNNQLEIVEDATLVMNDKSSEDELVVSEHNVIRDDGDKEKQNSNVPVDEIVRLEKEETLLQKIPESMLKEENHHIGVKPVDNAEAIKQCVELLKPKQEIVDDFQNMICEDKLYCATAYLKAAAVCDAQILPIYRKLAYAVNDPLEKCSYSSDALMGLYFDESSVLNDYFLAAALVRNYFMDHIGYDYSMQQLQSMTKGSAVLARYTSLNKIAYDLFEFKNKVHSGIDKYADYRAKDKVNWDEKLISTRNEAKGQYDAYVLGQIVERGSHKRFIETQKLIFAKEGDLAAYLKVVVDNDNGFLDLMKEFLQSMFIKTETLIDQVNIDDDKINAFIDSYWAKAGQQMMVVRKTSDLMGSFRMNLFKRVQKVVKVLCEWTVLMKSSEIDEDDRSFASYKKVRDVLLGNMDSIIDTLQDGSEKKRLKEEIVGRKVLLFTILELKKRLTGEYTEAESKYFYIGFLRNTKVLLNDEYLPNIVERVNELPEFFPLERIFTHSQEPEIEEIERIQQIFDSDDDYGTAQLLLKYIKSKGIDESELDILQLSIEESIKGAKKRAELRKDEFIENLELAQSYGQIENALEDKKDIILQSVNAWFARCSESGNFGFFYRILKAFDDKIKKEAKGRAETIREELESYCSIYQNLLDNERSKQCITKIKNMIEQQNYTVAEDLINRLVNDEVESEIDLLQNDYLQKFMDSHDYNSKRIHDTGQMLSRLVDAKSKAKKDIKGGTRLVEYWLSNGGRLGVQKLENLLFTLGFAVGKIQEQNRIAEKIETYNVFLKKPENGRRNNYKHPIAAFGSRAVEDGFRVVCLYGKYDADTLLATFKEIGNAKHTLIFLDFVLSLSERHRLARKIKAEIPDKIFGVVDRVVLMYLINNYEVTSINQMLMSIIMPFSYYQPYVVKSADVMPPEIFIGRKDELNKIEAPLGVNIVYGGRQLGKSALLRMAKTDINFDENGDRAVLVDIKGLDYKKAARKVAQALTDEHVFTHNVDSDDWDELAREIKKRLISAKEQKIPYLLLLMDEADVFIESCEKVDFHPFDALKDIQSIGQGRFKFVVAGLRNIVRFKRNIALGNNSVLTHLSSITVKPFNVMEARELLEIPLFYLGLRFTKEKDALVSMILATTNYFPGLLQMYCAKLLEAMKKGDYAGYNEKDTPPYDVQEKHIKKVLSEAGFQQDIREKFMITLKVDEDDYYYVIALLTAYLYYIDNDKNGYSSGDIIEAAREFDVAKIHHLSIDKLAALMEEMKELNVLRVTMNDRYLFTRYSFFQMMGTKNQIEEDIMNYMGE